MGSSLIILITQGIFFSPWTLRSAPWWTFLLQGLHLSFSAQIVSLCAASTFDQMLARQVRSSGGSNQLSGEGCFLSLAFGSLKVLWDRSGLLSSIHDYFSTVLLIAAQRCNSIQPRAFNLLQGTSYLWNGALSDTQELWSHHGTGCHSLRNFSIARLCRQMFHGAIARSFALFACSSARKNLKRKGRLAKPGNLPPMLYFLTWLRKDWFCCVL